jgi:hypothetical protein
MLNIAFFLYVKYKQTKRHKFKRGTVLGGTSGRCTREGDEEVNKIEEHGMHVCKCHNKTQSFMQ